MARGHQTNKTRIVCALGRAHVVRAVREHLTATTARRANPIATQSERRALGIVLCCESGPEGFSLAAGRAASLVLVRLLRRPWLSSFSQSWQWRPWENCDMGNTCSGSEDGRGALTFAILCHCHTGFTLRAGNGHCHHSHSLLLWATAQTSLWLEPRIKFCCVQSASPLRAHFIYTHAHTTADGQGVARRDEGFLVTNVVEPRGLLLLLRTRSERGRVEIAGPPTAPSPRAAAQLTVIGSTARGTGG